MPNSWAVSDTILVCQGLLKNEKAKDLLKLWEIKKEGCPNN